MTTPDPAGPSRTPAEPTSPQPGPARPASAAPDGPGAAATTLRDRWWWSPTLSIVVGAVVIGYQVGALTGPDPLWLNWVVAALGLAVAVTGVIRLLRAYRSL